LIFLCAAVVACAGGSLAELDGQPVLFDDVKAYYDRHAVEVAARCRTPELYTVLRTEVRERSADRLVIHVDYSFNDDNAELRDECRGFGARDFTVERRDGKLEVVEMSGIQNPKGIRIDRINTEHVW
jgi:hypothetical protein